MSTIPSFQEVGQHLQERYPTFNWDLDPPHAEKRLLGPQDHPLGFIYCFTATPIRVQFLFHEKKESVSFQIWYLAPQGSGEERWSYLVVEGGDPPSNWIQIAETAFERVYNEVIPAVDNLLDIWTKCHNSLPFKREK